MFFDPEPISFPGLGIGEINPPDGFSIFGFDIKFYGVIIAFGVLMAALYACRRAKEFGLTADDIYNCVLIGVPCAIVGARLYYVLLYGTPFNQWLNIRDGGIAIYGGVIGAVTGVGVFSLFNKERRKKFLPCADMAGLGLLIGQSIGRWGNFFNREAFGSYCDNIFAMRLPESCLNGLSDSAVIELREKAIDGFVQVHPTFLYESVWNAVGLVLLHFLSKKRKFDGQVFLYYAAWYGLGRMWIEGLRTDSLMGGSLRFSQVVAIVSVIVSVALLVWILLRRPNPEKMLVNQSRKEEP